MIPLNLMHGCKNTFFLIDEWNGKLVANKKDFVKSICNLPEWGLIDGVLFFKKSNQADLEMKIYDRDGSEETMCGNGIRCVAKYYFDNYTDSDYAIVETGDGLKEVRQIKDNIEVKMGSPRDFKKIKDYYYVFTGCPHLVSISQNYSFSDIEFLTGEGRKLSHDLNVCSKLGITPEEGIYVNFINPNTKQLITYERHLEKCTFACGTGNTAVGYVLHTILGFQLPIRIFNRGGIINIDFHKKSNNLIMSGAAEYIKRIFINYN